MSQDSNFPFPWKDFALWLREGVIGARILNKLMRASNPAGPAMRVIPEEVDLLNTVQKLKTSHDAHRAALNNLVETLKPNSHYPNTIKNEQIQALWVILMDYGMSAENTEKIKGQLEEFLGAQSTPAEVFMDCVWRSLGPALAPERNMIEE